MVGLILPPTNRGSSTTSKVVTKATTRCDFGWTFTCCATSSLRICGDGQGAKVKRGEERDSSKQAKGCTSSIPQNLKAGKQ